MFSRPDSNESSVSTRRGDYRPAAPESLSTAGKMIVGIEVFFVVAVIATLSTWLAWGKLRELQPVRIASIAPPKLVIPAASAGSLADGDFDVAKGKMFYMQACTSCHGLRGQGMPHQGVSLRESKFVATTSDRALVAFVKKGRPAMDPKNTSGLLMPPRGGNPALDDEALGAIVGFMRQLQKEHLVEAAATEAQTKSPATQPMADVEQERASLDSDAQ